MFFFHKLPIAPCGLLLVTNNHIRTYKESLGWAFVVVGMSVLANTLIFEVNLA